MGNAALVKPMEVIVSVDEETGTASSILRMEFQALTTAGFTGYLAKLNYFPGWTGGTSGYEMPSSQTPVAAVVESYYENTYDAYNDPETGEDANVKGKLYPHYMTMPVVLGDEEIWVQVYVPVMEAITAGSGLQYAKLQLDWDTLEQKSGIADTDETILALKELLEAEVKDAKALDTTGASAEDLALLEDAIAAAEAILENPNASASAVSATRQMLNAAMSVFGYEELEADKSTLERAIALAESYLNSVDVVYTEATLGLLETAYNQAVAVMADEDATQTEVNLCVEAIAAAIEGLVSVSDKSELRNALYTAKIYLNDTELYTAASIDMLESLYETALAVYNGNASQDEVDAQVRILKYALTTMVPANQTVVDKTGLYSMILAAVNQASRTDLYTTATITKLNTAVTAAKTVYLDASADQSAVNTQLNALLEALMALEIDPDIYYSSDDDDDSDLDHEDLDDGEYYLTGRMFKTDKSTKSMADAAIDHTVTLTVDDGDYYLTLEFDGITISGKYGYLGSLKYFTNSYSVNSYGAPTGTTKAVTVKSYQKEDGKTVKDDYGSKYPAVVKFKLIDKALDDGWVPLQVYVPIMEAISEGTGTQPVWLKLYWNTLEEDEDDVDDVDTTTTTTITTTAATGTTDALSSLLNFESTLGTAGSTGSAAGTAQTGNGLSAMAPVGTTQTGYGTAPAAVGGNGAAAGSGLKISSGVTNNSALDKMLNGGSANAGIPAADQAANSLTELPQFTNPEAQAVAAAPVMTVTTQNRTSDSAKETKNPVSAFPMVSSLLIMLAGLFYQLKGKKFFGV